MTLLKKNHFQQFIQINQTIKAILKPFKYFSIDKLSEKKIFLRMVEIMNNIYNFITIKQNDKTDSFNTSIKNNHYPYRPISTHFSKRKNVKATSI